MGSQPLVQIPPLDKDPKVKLGALTMGVSKLVFGGRGRTGKLEWLPSGCANESRVTWDFLSLADSPFCVV